MLTKTATPKLFDLLTQVPGHDDKPGKVPFKRLHEWASADRHDRLMSFARGYLLGRALVARKPANGVEKWAREKIGLSPQMVNTYIRGYEAISELGDEFVIPEDMAFTAWVRGRGTRPADEDPRTAALKKARSAISRLRRTIETTDVDVLLEAGLGDLVEWIEERNLTLDLKDATLKGLQADIAKTKTQIIESERSTEAIKRTTDRIKAVIAEHRASTQEEVEPDPDDDPPPPHGAPSSAASTGKGTGAAPVVSLRRPQDRLSVKKQVFGLLPYPGGKRFSVNDIKARIGRLDDNTVLVDPFVGGGVVPMHMLARGLVTQVRLNDADPSVAALYNAVIQQPEELIRRVLNFQLDHGRVCELMDAIMQHELEGMDLALAEIVVRRGTHRHLGVTAGKPYRTWLKKRWVPELDAARIRQSHEILRGRVVGGACTNLDALEVIAEAGDRFLFLDPPYLTQGPAVYRCQMSWEQHQALAAALRQTEHPWLLCYDASPEIRQLYEGNDIDTVTVAHTGRATKGSAGQVHRQEFRIESGRAGEIEVRKAA